MPGADYSPQEGSQGLTLPSQGQGLPMPPSSVGVPMRGPAGPPALPQTPQPDFASIARAVGQQQQLANNPLYAFGAGMQGINPQQGVMQSQMQLAQMIQQQRQSAMAEQAQHQQMLQSHIKMMLEVGQGITSGMLPPAFADTIGPYMEQQHQQLFGSGAPYEGQALPIQAGDFAKMLKAGGDRTRNYIEGQQYARPEDMPTAVRMEASKPGSGVAFLQAQKKTRLDNLGPLIEQELGALHDQLKTPDGGAVTKDQLVAAANQYLDKTPPEALQAAYKEDPAFLKHALQQYLQDPKSDKFLTDRGVQVGLTKPTDMGISNEFSEFIKASPTFQAAKIDIGQLRTLPLPVQTKINAEAQAAQQKFKVEQSAMQQYSGHLALANADLKIPLVANPKYANQVFVNQDTGLPVDMRQSPEQLGLSPGAKGGPPIARLTQKDYQSVEALNGALQDVARLTDLVKQKSGVPGYNVNEAIVDWYKAKTGQTNLADAINAYQMTKEKIVRAMTQARPSDTQIQRVPFPEVDITKLHVDGASSGLNKLKNVAEILMGTRDSLLQKPGAESDVLGKINDAIEAVQNQAAQETAPAQRAEQKITIHDTTGTFPDRVVPMGTKLQKGWVRK